MKRPVKLVPDDAWGELTTVLRGGVTMTWYLSGCFVVAIRNPLSGPLWAAFALQLRDQLTAERRQ